MTRLRQYENNRGLSDFTDTLNPGVDNTRVFYSAVVVDFISNPEEYLNANSTSEDEEDISNRESLKSGKNKVENPELVDFVPRNSIIGWIVSDRASRSSGPMILYPFFSPHMCMPVKAGEQVWIVFEHAGTKSKIGYWLTRKATNLQVDDLNYTHQDRITLPLVAAAKNQSASNNHEESNSDEFDPASFPLGGYESRESNTLPGDDPYEEIVDKSSSYQTQHTGEPVPRFSKRAGDCTLQGSNNTLIVLGEDRPSSTESDTDIKGKGTIDMVAGRGVLLKSGEFLYDSDGKIDIDENISSPSAIVENSRLLKEIDKAPDVNTKNDVKTANPAEGDPDYINDLSRIYVSMKTDGDKNFGIDSESESLPTAFDSSIDDADQDAYTIFKSNQIRIVARKNDDHDINGSIRIIKEGTRNEDLAAIIILPDGTVQISGKKIFIGRHEDDGGTKSDEDDSGADPYMKFSEFKAYMNDTLDAVDTKINSLATKVQSFANSITSGGTTMGYGAPNIPFISPSITLSMDATALQNEQDVKDQKNDTMDNIKSERIFGE